MGIINVTPDSFSDGGDWFNPEKAIAHALELEAAVPISSILGRIRPAGSRVFKSRARTTSSAAGDCRLLKSISQPAANFFRYCQCGNRCRWHSCRSTGH
ncbi:MAG: dihydropteroate synthase [Varibaculum cambriense]